MTRFTDQKTINLVTYRKNGRGVSTPVWCADHGGFVYAFSNGKAGKVKRLRNSPKARVAPCTFSGKIIGEEVGAKAFVVDDAAERTAALDTLARKYGFSFRVVSFFARLTGRHRHWAIIRIELAAERAAEASR
tara:strand:- start:845 stop:1243 length:399 start_codon:yes stop_codon:yes gene_type:complete